MNETTTLRTAADVTDEVLAAAIECAEAAYGLGNHWRIEWEVAYGMLESQHGYFIDEYDSPADRKIKRYVRENGDFAA